MASMNLPVGGYSYLVPVMHHPSQVMQQPNLTNFPPPHQPHPMHPHMIVYPSHHVQVIPVQPPMQVFQPPPPPPPPALPKARNWMNVERRGPAHLAKKKQQASGSMDEEEQKEDSMNLLASTTSESEGEESTESGSESSESSADSTANGHGAALNEHKQQYRPRRTQPPPPVAPSSSNTTTSANGRYRPTGPPSRLRTRPQLTHLKALLDTIQVGQTIPHEPTITKTNPITPPKKLDTTTTCPSSSSPPVIAIAIPVASLSTATPSTASVSSSSTATSPTPSTKETTQLAITISRKRGREQDRSIPEGIPIATATAVPAATPIMASAVSSRSPHSAERPTPARPVTLEPHLFRVDSEDTAICCVCEVGDSTDDNQILFCDGRCALAYHQECLVQNTTQLPEGDWFCSEECSNHASSMNDDDEEATLTDAQLLHHILTMRTAFHRHRLRTAALSSSITAATSVPSASAVPPPEPGLHKVTTPDEFWQIISSYFDDNQVYQSRKALYPKNFDTGARYAPELGPYYKHIWCEEDQDPTVPKRLLTYMKPARGTEKHDEHEFDYYYELEDYSINNSNSHTTASSQRSESPTRSNTSEMAPSTPPSRNDSSTASPAAATNSNTTPPLVRLRSRHPSATTKRVFQAPIRATILMQFVLPPASSATATTSPTKATSSTDLSTIPTATSSASTSAASSTSLAGSLSTTPPVSDVASTTPPPASASAASGSTTPPSSTASTDPSEPATMEVDDSPAAPSITSTTSVASSSTESATTVDPDAASASTSAAVDTAPAHSAAKSSTFTPSHTTPSTDTAQTIPLAPLLPPIQAPPLPFFTLRALDRQYAKEQCVLYPDEELKPPVPYRFNNKLLQTLLENPTPQALSELTTVTVSANHSHRTRHTIFQPTESDRLPFAGHYHFPQLLPSTPEELVIEEDTCATYFSIPPHLFQYELQMKAKNAVHLFASDPLATNKSSGSVVVPDDLADVDGDEISSALWLARRELMLQIHLTNEVKKSLRATCMKERLIDAASVLERQKKEEEQRRILAEYRHRFPSSSQLSSSFNHPQDRIVRSERTIAAVDKGDATMRCSTPPPSQQSTSSTSSTNPVLPPSPPDFMRGVSRSGRQVTRVNLFKQRQLVKATVAVQEKTSRSAAGGEDVEMTDATSTTPEAETPSVEAPKFKTQGLLPLPVFPSGEFTSISVARAHPLSTRLKLKLAIKKSVLPDVVRASLSSVRTFRHKRKRVHEVVSSESEDDVVVLKGCVICHEPCTLHPEKVVLCDTCDGEIHFDCCTPPLKRVPRERFDCPVCVQAAAANFLDGLKDGEQWQQLDFELEPGIQETIAGHLQATAPLVTITTTTD